MGSAPSPPPAPDPVATAQAQTGENVDTAVANATLSHVNQTDPGGDTSTYSSNSTTPFTDPVSGQTYQIPNYSQSTSLSPANQQIYNTNQATQGNIADTANIQSQQIGASLDNPINLKGITQSGVNLQSLPNLQNVTLQQLGALPDANLTASNINNFIGTNWEQPLAYSQGNQQEQMNQSLADQGIDLNDPAYNEAQINEGQNFQQQQDTYADSMYGTAASNILGSTALADQNLVTQNQVNNQNTLAQTGFNNSNLVNENQINNQNAVTQQGFNNNAAATQQGFNNQVALTNQNQPINAITALMGGSQVSQPNFMSTPQTQIPTTDYASIVQNSYQDQLASYNAQVQAQSASTGGLFGLGGSVLGGLVGL